MASDGCQEPTWYGKAFPFLMHHPNGVQSLSSQQQQQSYRTNPAPSIPAAAATAATGTWNGPAPRGAQDPVRPPSSSASRGPQPRTVPLPGGARLSLLGLSTEGVTEAEVVRQALAGGVRHFDAAAVEGNEAIVGEGLKQFIADGHRDQLFITSKAWNDSHRPAVLRTACEASIAKLGCSYLDLYLLHWPEAWTDDSSRAADPDASIEETWAAMEGLVDAGLARAIGVANFSLAQLEEILAFAHIKPVVNQVELHPRLAQRKLVGTAMRKGVLSAGRSPLGPEGLAADSQVAAVAQAAGRSAEEVLLRWNVQRGIPVLVPAAALQANLADSLFSWELSLQQKGALDKLDCGERVVSPEWHEWADPEQGGALKPSAVL